MAFTWTVEAIEDLRTMHARGDSDSTMARALSEKYQTMVTRNAIIGKRHRLSMGDNRLNKAKAYVRPVLRNRPAPRPREQAAQDQHIVQKIEQKKLTRIELHATAENHFSLDVPGMECAAIGIEDLHANNCHWPLDRGGFCGGVALFDMPYCETHCRAAYRSIEQVREAARKFERT